MEETKRKTLQGQSKRKGQRQTIYVGAEADVEDLASFDGSSPEMFFGGEKKRHMIIFQNKDKVERMERRSETTRLDENEGTTLDAWMLNAGCRRGTPIVTPAFPL